MKEIRHIVFAAIMALTAFVAPALAAVADDYPRVLVVSMTDGSLHVFSLASKPKVTFSKPNVTIANDKTTIEYPFAEIQKFYFVRQEDIPQSISDAVPVKRVVRQPSRHVYEIEGEELGAGIVVTDIGGRSFAHCVSGIANGIRIDLSGAPVDIYVVRLSKEQSMKFIRK